jgi:hypothetical protein
LSALITASTTYGILANMCRHVLTCSLLILIVSTAALCGDDLLTPEEHCWLNDIKSRIVIAVESGYNVQSVEDIINNDSHAGFVHKPYKPEDLLDVVVRQIG